MSYTYQVFERGGLYRVAAPRWLSWNWARHGGEFGSLIFETTIRSKADAKAERCNKLQGDWSKYNKDYWKAV